MATGRYTPDRDLPWLGLGLATNLDGRAPDPFALHASDPGLFDYVEYSAPLDVREARRDLPQFTQLARLGVPTLYHPVHLNLFGPALEPAESLSLLDAHLREVGSPWVSNDVAWWHTEGRAFPGYLYVAPPLDAASLSACAAHALHVQSHLSVPLALENPAVVARRGPMHVLDFLGELHGRTGLPLLLDLGHLLSHQLTAGLAATSGFDGFPFEAVLELHLAGGLVRPVGQRAFYSDDHTQPVPEALFELLGAVLERCKALRAVTFEGDGQPTEIAARTLARVRRLVPRRPLQPVQPLPATGSTPVAPPLGYSGEAGRELLDAVFGTSDGRADPGAHAAERGYRLAVLAQSLDRTWPLTRLLVAGSPAQLGAFAESRAFREVWMPGGPDLQDAFAAHARALLRAAPDEALSRVLSFETLANGVALGSPRQPRPGELTLAPDVGLVTFPLDLTEVLFAARAVRRHLTDLSWGTGELAPEALRAVGEVVLRAAPGPWTCAVRRGRGRLTIEPLTRELAAFLRRLPLRAAEADRKTVDEALGRALAA